MKPISDEEWEKIFLSGEREREQQERELFEQAVSNFDDFSSQLEEELPRRLNSPGLQRKIPKSISPEIDATLDLHMKTKEEAKVKLLSFFRQAVADGDRTLLVITGKGHHSPGKGVLRDFARQWFNGEGARWISWYAEAPGKLGGKGAWLVRLLP